jgi:hypothetical protein
MTTTTRYLTDAEILQAAMNHLRLRHGMSATPDQQPNYWRTCMIIAEGAADGGALELLAVGDDAREIARKSAPKTFSRPVRVYSRDTGRRAAWGF